MGYAQTFQRVRASRIPSFLFSTVNPWSRAIGGVLLMTELEHEKYASPVDCRYSLRFCAELIIHA